MNDAELIRDHLSYDPQTGRITWIKRSGRRSVIDAEAGTVTPQGYRMVRLCGRMFLGHRLAWFFVNGAMPTERLDHINGDRLDNRISNLRQVDKYQNRWNSARTGTDLPKGVNRTGQRFRAKIGFRGKRYRLGIYDTAEEAHAAYCEAARRLHGEFARFA